MKINLKLIILPLLFSSGLCALVYQTVWIREFRLIFGASTLSISAVMAIFLGGIGFGSIYLGRYAEKHRQPLKLYGQLEIAITLAAVMSPFLIYLVRMLYLAVGGSFTIGPFFSTILRLFLSTVVIGGPTFLMGGTLPAMARAFETDSDINRNRLGLLYAANTIGAFLGLHLATFFLLEMLGTVSTLWAACLLNLFVGLAALLAARNIEPLDSSIEAEPSEKETSTDTITPEKTTFNKEHILLLSVATISGFIFLVMELVWYRMLTPLLGGTTYSFGLVLAIVLVGIGLGGWLYSYRKDQGSLYSIALICSLEAFFLALPFAIGDDIAILAILLQYFGVYGFVGTAFSWAVIIAIVVLPASILSGYLFPLLVGQMGKGRHNVAVQTGQIYAFNTLGVIIGSLTGGFILIPALSAPGSWQLMVTSSIMLSVALTIFSFTRYKKIRPSDIMAILLCCLAGVMLTTTGPTTAWRHSAIGVGQSDFPINQGLRSFNAVRTWLNKERGFLLFESDGKESSLGLVNYDGYSFVINGKADGNAFNDAATQVMAPMVGAILHPDPKKAMVIGVGSGSSGGWLGSIPTMERVDQIELEPDILKVAEYSAQINNRVMENPKVRTMIGDGREFLLTSKDKYDLIFSEPSNPYRAGVASLFTRELYQAAAEKLEKGGIFSQWVQGYDIDGKTLHMIYATLHSVFPSVEIWITHPDDLLFVCSMEIAPHSLPFIRQKIKSEPYRSALYKTWGVVDAEGFFAHYLAQPALAPILVGDDIRNNLINTDDRMFIEFSFAKTALLKKDVGIINELRKKAWQHNLVQPNLTGGILNTYLVNQNIILLDALFNRSVMNPYQRSDTQQRLRSYVIFNKLDRLAASSILESWGKQNRSPEYPLEIAMLAESYAEVGAQESLELAERLRVYFPIDAEAILARYYFHTGNPDLALQHLSNSLVAYRSNPWVIKQIMFRALNLTLELANSHPEKAGELFDLIFKPFSVGMMEATRRNILVEMSTRLGRQACVNALAQMEPHIVPWDKPVLEYRLKCYEQAGHHLAGKAADDLELFNNYSNRFQMKFDVN